MGRDFCCGVNKDRIYQKRIRIAFNKALDDYIDDEVKADSLRQLIGQIEDTERIRD